VEWEKPQLPRISERIGTSGKKVVLIDTDIGLRNLDVVMGLENRIVYDLVDVVEVPAELSRLNKRQAFRRVVSSSGGADKDKTAVNPEGMIKINCAKN